MVKNICRDLFILGKKSSPASLMDMQVAINLIDTLAAHEDSCVGMAANMIGVLKRIIVFDNMGESKIMINPEIISKSGKYETEEGCLSLQGVRKAIRYKNIEVKYQDMGMMPHVEKYSGFTAQIIQHEIDHLEGIII